MSHRCLREAHGCRMALSLTTGKPDAQKGDVVCWPKPALLVGPDKVSQKPVVPSGIVLGDVLVM